MNSDLPATIAEQLRRAGETSAVYHSPVERDRLRAAGRLLNRSVRTSDTAARHSKCNADECGTIRVVLTDWGTNPLERQLAETRANKAIDHALNTP